MVAPVTFNVPAITVLPVSASTVNLLVLTLKSPVTSKVLPTVASPVTAKSLLVLIFPTAVIVLLVFMVVNVPATGVVDPITQLSIGVPLKSTLLHKISPLTLVAFRNCPTLGLDIFVSTNPAKVELV